MDVEQWITGHAHECYLVVVGLFGGHESAPAIVGNIALAMFVTITFITATYAFSSATAVGIQLAGIGAQIAAIGSQLVCIGWRLLQFIVFAGIVLFLGVWTVRLYGFVYPGQAPVHAAAVKEAASQAVTNGTGWMTDWWNKAWQSATQV